METLLIDTLVIVQCGGWLQSYLQCWPPAEEPQRGTKWPTAKIWHCKWVFFLVLNRAFMFLSSFFVRYMKFSFRENTASSSQVSLQHSFSTVHSIWKDICVVTLWLSGIWLCCFLLKGHSIYNLRRFVLRYRKRCKSHLPSAQNVKFPIWQLSFILTSCVCLENSI